MAKATLRLIFVASLCVGLTGCAEVVVSFAGQFLGEALKQAFPPKISSVNPYQLAQAQADSERCRDLARKGVEVTEPLGIAIPTNAGEVQTHEATIWRLHAAGERVPQREAEGTLAITEQSVLLVPPPGTAGVLIPYEVVLTVETDPIHTYSMNVRSCTWRFETFQFWRRESNTLDPEAAAAATAQLTTRLAAFRATARKQTESPQ